MNKLWVVRGLFLCTMVLLSVFALSQTEAFAQGNPDNNFYDCGEECDPDFGLELCGCCLSQCAEVRGCGLAFDLCLLRCNYTCLCDYTNGCA